MMYLERSNDMATGYNAIIVLLIENRLALCQSDGSLYGYMAKARQQCPYTLYLKTLGVEAVNVMQRTKRTL